MLSMLFVTCSRSTSCSVFFFQIPVNADKDADGVVAAAAAIVVDDALYIYCQRLVCFFSFADTRVRGGLYILLSSFLLLFLQIRIRACR